MTNTVAERVRSEWPGGFKENTFEHVKMFSAEAVVAYSPALEMIFIDSLYTPKETRRRGHAKALIFDLKQRVKDFGWLGIYVDTLEFQAPNFYEHCGFKLVWTQETAAGKRFWYEWRR